MKEKDKIREKVSRSYAKAVKQQSGGCCGVPTNGSIASKVGYGAEELSGVPQRAVSACFACGNPFSQGEVREGETVLDLGAGAGMDLIIASRLVGPSGRVIGVDMTDEMVETAKRNIAEAGVTNVEVRKGLIEDLPVDSNSVDWVISNCVINLSPDKQKVFSEIYRVLKPGGKMVVSDIVAINLPSELREDEEVYCSCIGGAISEDEYIDGLLKAGLTDVEVSSRQKYTPQEIAELLGATSESGSSCGCCGTQAKVDMATCRELSERVWSARFFARKPL